MALGNKLHQISAETMIVGIDIAKNVHWAQITDSRGSTLSKPMKISSNIESFQQFLNKVLEIQSKNGFQDIIVGFEPSGHYWKTLACFLKAENIPIAGVNPYHVKSLKELEDNSQTKNDKKDALVIAHLIRDGRFFELYLPDDAYAELRVLKRHRSQLSDRRKSVMNTIQVILDEYFPELEILGFGVDTASMKAMLRLTPLPEDFITLGEAGIMESWRASGLKTRRMNMQLIKELCQAAKNSIGVKYAQLSTRQRLIDTVNQLDLLDSQIAMCENQMAQIMEHLDIQKYLTSIPGVGSVVAAGFIAETGNLARFDDWKQLQKLAGLNLTEQSSGQHKGKTKISKRGRPGLRCIIYQLGDKGMLVNPEMRLLYDYLRHRPNNPLQHTQALLAIGLKMMRIMFHVVRYKQFYDPIQALGEFRLQQIYGAA
jgi:transposase